MEEIKGREGRGACPPAIAIFAFVHSEGDHFDGGGRAMAWHDAGSKVCQFGNSVSLVADLMHLIVNGFKKGKTG